MYRLKKVVSAWYYHLDRYIWKKGFRKGSIDNNLYIKFDEEIFLIVVVYVHDIIFGSNVESMSQGFYLVMQQEFEIPLLVELTYFLGLQVQQTKDGTFLYENKYLKQIIKKYGVEDYKHVWTLVVTRWNLSQNVDSPSFSQLEYRSMIGGMIYLIGKRHKILHVVGIVRWLQVNLGESHPQTIKRIFKYLQGTQDFILWYPKN